MRRLSDTNIGDALGLKPNPNLPILAETQHSAVRSLQLLAAHLYVRHYRRPGFNQFYGEVGVGPPGRNEPKQMWFLVDSQHRSIMMSSNDGKRLVSFDPTTDAGMLQRQIWSNTSRPKDRLLGTACRPPRPFVAICLGSPASIGRLQSPFRLHPRESRVEMNDAKRKPRQLY